MPTLRFILFAGVVLALGERVGGADSRDGVAVTDTEPSTPADNEELARLYAEDQADRRPAAGLDIDWAVVGARDRVRQARVKELYGTNQLKTGADYYHAAMVLQHGDVPEDYLLAHELCVVALGKGYTRALWLAAATEDRFLRNIGRPQRFGTQYLTPAGGGTVLQETDLGVTDEHRRAMNVPALAEAKARASRFDRTPSAGLKPKDDAPALKQDVFSASDDAYAALQKVRMFRANNDEELVRLLRACRDLTVRFPAPTIRANAIIHAAVHWSRVSPELADRLDGWNPAVGERDPEFTPEQRALVAMRLAIARASRRARTAPAVYDEAQFEEVAKAAAAHRTTAAAREALVDAALHIAPAVAVRQLRETLPASNELNGAVKLIELIGQPIELELNTVEGGTIRLRDLRGRVVLLHFFAQRFSGSVSFIPRLKELVEQHGAGNLVLIGINTDLDSVAAKRMAIATGITWPVHCDRSGSPSVTDRYRAKILPYYLLVDRAGNLRYRGVAPTAPQTLDRITELIAEPAPLAP